VNKSLAVMGRSRPIARMMSAGRHDLGNGWLGRSCFTSFARCAMAAARTAALRATQTTVRIGDSAGPTSLLPSRARVDSRRSFARLLHVAHRMGDQSPVPSVDAGGVAAALLDEHYRGHVVLTVAVDRRTSARHQQPQKTCSRLPILYSMVPHDLGAEAVVMFRRRVDRSGGSTVVAGSYTGRRGASWCGPG
jgi:hypothetical protein